MSLKINDFKFMISKIILLPKIHISSHNSVFDKIDR